MTPTLKRKVFEIIELSITEDNRASRIFNGGMMGLILLNVILAIIGTEAVLYARYRILFDTVEAFSVIVFTVEYILRIWSCTENPKYNGSFLGRIKYALTPSMLIDLFAFLPFYIPAWGMDLRMLRIVRLSRLFRLVKVWRYSKSLALVQKVFKSKKEELGIALLLGIILLVVSSSLLYFIEHEAQPEAFSSIPAAMWWGVTTLTTVGYGDMYPITPLGRIAGAMIAILGIGLFALPAGIVASGFAAELEARSKKPQTCPHCGKEIDMD